MIVLMILECVDILQWYLFSYLVDISIFEIELICLSFEIEVNSLESHINVVMPFLREYYESSCEYWLLKVYSNFGVPVCICLKDFTPLNILPQFSVYCLGNLNLLNPIISVSSALPLQPARLVVRRPGKERGRGET